MARRAVEALAELAAEPAASSDELLERLDAAGRELAATRRAMGAIAGAVGRVLAAAHHGAHLEPDELRRLVQEEVQGLVAGRDRAAASIAIQLADVLTDATVLTHSASATVREAVLYTRPERVLCTVSAPFEEGRAFSEDLRSSGLDVELVEDDDAVDALQRCSLVLVGADTVFRDGAVCNKVGTHPLAEEATRVGVRTVVACEVIKLAPIDAPDRIDDEHFDVTPAVYIEDVVTEEGTFPSDEVRALVDRTPFLAEGYAILRAG
jgi:translation initiation factor 2B subunit (eIF-2B alpha/beta/delta family)